MTPPPVKPTAPRTAHTLWAFVDEFLVVCPQCDRRALVRQSTEITSPRLLCGHCGLAHDWQVKKRGVWFSDRVSDSLEGAYVLGAPADPYFHVPLWLQTPCRGHTLWAYNAAHLAFLRAYVRATDRRRAEREDTGPRNQLLESRLPRWVKAAKNRETVARGLAVLERRLR